MQFRSNETLFSIEKEKKYSFFFKVCGIKSARMVRVMLVYVINSMVIFGKYLVFLFINISKAMYVL